MLKHSMWGIGVIVAGMMLLTGCDKKADTVQTDHDAVKVETARLAEQTFRKQIRVQGTIQPIDRATIAARVAGTIDSLEVREGVRVKKGEVLFQTDRKNLENQVLVAEQSLKVAEETCQTVREDIEIAKTTLDKAKADYERAQRLFASNAVSLTSFETAEADWKCAQATYRREQAVLKYNLVKVSQAKTNLEIAQKNLADSIIRAPYDGVITNRFHDAGEFAAAGEKVLEIEDQGRLEVSAKISSLYYAALSLETDIVLLLEGKELCRTHLSYLSPSVDPLSRTFEIKANLPGQKDLVSGTLCDIDIIIAERWGQGLPTDAVLARARGRYAVFVVKDGKAEEITVATGFSTRNNTEILNAEKLAGRDLVVSGQYFLNDGSAVVTTARKDANHDAK